MTTDSLVEYLHNLEDEDSFVPWDNDAHAAQNLQTTFDIHPEYAKAIVALANISTKEAPE